MTDAPAAVVPGTREALRGPVIAQIIRDHAGIADWLDANWIDEAAEAIAQRAALSAPVPPADAARIALEHAKTRFACLVDHFKEVGEEALCVMSEVDGERMDMKMVRRWGWNISPAGQKIVCRDARDAVARFEHALQWDEAIHQWVRDELRGRDLACWCSLDRLCHADVLLRIANSDPAAIRAANNVVDEAIFAAGRAALAAHTKEG